MPDTDFAAAILRYRAAHNLNQAQFAKLCGLSTKTIWNAEHGVKLFPVTEAKIRLILEGEK